MAISEGDTTHVDRFQTTGTSWEGGDELAPSSSFSANRNGSNTAGFSYDRDLIRILKRRRSHLRFVASTNESSSLLVPFVATASELDINFGFSEMPQDLGVKKPGLRSWPYSFHHQLGLLVSIKAMSRFTEDFPDDNNLTPPWTLSAHLTECLGECGWMDHGHGALHRH